jgi:tryptophan 2,3-dioxygenase
MTPLQFNSFRSYLSSSSGFQSAQIKLFTAKNSVWDSALAYINKRGHKIPIDVLNRDKSASYAASKGVQEVLRSRLFIEHSLQSNISRFVGNPL